MNLYVGNLPFQTSEDDLQAAFATFGQVASVTIIRDKFSGESRGFGFVEMPDQAAALAAIAGLAGKEMAGRAITVNEARPREDSGRRGGRGSSSRGSW